GPVPYATFCPTGGSSPENYNAYLALSNVACVGGPWLAPAEAVKTKDWAKVTELARQAIANVKSA
ncbi:MAG: keto-deoxy-phosphogluconate aldolase, partial [Methylovulum sp.]|nr:keto-deoxy-phosphogluconate aldolase [Methylovulum sp.]